MKLSEYIVATIVLIILGCCIDDIYTNDVAQPQNMSCIFYGKRTLNCTYDTYDRIAYSQHTCYAGKLNFEKVNGTQCNKCPPNIEKELVITTGRPLSDRSAMCSYECKEMHLCRENIMMTVVSYNPLKNDSFCHIAKLSHIIQPAPVKDLQVTNIANSSLRVQWNKPDDQDNDNDTYVYTVTWVLEKGGRSDSMTLRNRNTAVSMVISNLKRGCSYTISVAAKPGNRGYWSNSSSKQAIMIDETGPVRNLQVTDLGNTSLGVQWKKPYDPDNDEATYEYIITWVLEEGGNTNKKTLRNGGETVSTVIPYLKPLHRYNIVIAAELEIDECRSNPSFIQATVDESVPNAGPVIPAGSYSVQNKTHLGIYWQIIPEECRGGQIVEYEIMVVNSNMSKKTTQTWAAIKFPRSEEDRVKVFLKAATKKGFSNKNTTVEIFKSTYERQTILTVQRRGEEVVWTQKSGQVPDEIRVHRCYGIQTIHEQQLVDCKTEVEYTSKSHLKWPDPPAPALSFPCERCQWHYAVSVHNNNSTAGMVWNTTPDPEEQSPESNAIIYAGVVLSLLIVGFVFIYMLKGKVLCKTYQIVLPRDIMDDPLLENPQLARSAPDDLSDSSHECMKGGNESKSNLGLGNVFVPDDREDDSVESGTETVIEREGLGAVNQTPVSESSRCTDILDGSMISDYRIQFAYSEQEEDDYRSWGTESAL